MLWQTPEAWHRPECWELTPSEVAWHEAFLQEASNQPHDVRAQRLDLLCRAIENSQNAASAWTLHQCCMRWSFDAASAARYRTLVADVAKHLALPCLPTLSPGELANRRGILLAEHLNWGADGWTQAADAFEAGADGSACAKNNLAYCTERGLGRRRDPAAARRLYEGAISDGSLAAYDNLAAMMQYGLGGAADVPRAIAMLCRGLTAGDVLCGHVLGAALLTESGHRTPYTREAAREMLLAEVPSAPLPHLRELRGRGRGRDLGLDTRRQIVALDGMEVHFALWQAPLYEAIMGHDVAACPLCGRSSLLLGDDPENRAEGCLSCLAARRFGLECEPGSIDLPGAHTRRDRPERMPEEAESPDADTHSDAAGPTEQDWAGWHKALRFTPRYYTWQDEAYWPVHCRAPCIYLGSFGADDFHYVDATADGYTTFVRAVANMHEGYMNDRAQSSSCSWGRTEWHAFRCQKCHELLASLDLS